MLSQINWVTVGYSPITVVFPLGHCTCHNTAASTSQQAASEAPLLWGRTLGNCNMGTVGQWVVASTASVVGAGVVGVVVGCSGDGVQMGAASSLGLGQNAY